MPKDGEGIGRAVNTGGRADGLMLFLLLVNLEPLKRALNSACEWLRAGLPSPPGPGSGAFGRFIRDAASWVLAPSHGTDDVHMGLMLVCVALLVVLLGRGALGRLVGQGRYDMGRAAFMALAGAVVVLIASVLPFAFLGVLAGGVLPNWLSTGLDFLAFPLACCMAGVWSGWRFGKWGWAWGLAGFAGAVLVISGRDTFVPFSLGYAALGTFLLACSAASGYLGARWFQRSLRRRPPQPPRPAAPCGGSSS
jgi:hypothetical protein